MGLDEQQAADPAARVGALVAAAGIAGRRVRRVVRLLVDGPQSLTWVVENAAVDRRTVEQVRDAVRDDLIDDGAGRVRIAPGRVDAYRELAGAGADPHPYGELLQGRWDLVERLREHLAAAPASLSALDHVPATAETTVRRAVWLDRTYDLAGARVLCIGDHDQTSVALAAVCPAVAITVVDVDDAVLGHVDDAGAARCLWADFRFGLPNSVRGWADLIVTDPPYTPDGVRLFLARGVQGLRDKDQGRLVMAYGFGEQPALGVKVQQAVTGLQLAYEAILPAFNRYHGAQALGSASDLYVLRPTARSFRAADATTSGVNIYTHGDQSLEGGSGELPPELADALLAAARGPDDLPVTLLGSGPAALPLSTVLSSESIGTSRLRPDAAVAVDLRADPGSWLARVLLVLSAARAGVLVPNNHPDLVNEAAQRRLVDLLAAKYRLRLRRSTPGPKHAIVEAERIEPSGAAGLATRAVLDRAHGKVANTWREALVAVSGGRLTKKAARDLIRATLPDMSTVDEQLIALPRWRVAAVLAAIARSAETLSPASEPGAPAG